jgi:hypothetical protein
MSRAAKIVLAGVVLAAVVGIGAYFCVMKLCARQMAADDLSWLKREFRLSDSEMRRVRQLHEGYLPKCREMCGKIAEKEGEVEKALGSGKAPDAKLTELATLRAQCQAQMLRHFEEVSRAMPPEQGKRYLSEMQRMTLGFHQDIERSMGELPASGHGHGDH